MLSPSKKALLCSFQLGRWPPLGGNRALKSERCQVWLRTLPAANFVGEDYLGAALGMHIA